MIPAYLIYDNKGNRYGAYRSLKEAIVAKALSEIEAKNFLIQYDLEAYEKYFGELEEA